MEHPSKTLKRYELFPTKRLSQNFLTNTHSLDGIENLFKQNDVILEIGPGLGAVTDYLLNHKFLVILCEKDRNLSAFLNERYQQKIEIITDDFLKIPPNQWNQKKITSCVSNLPFHITTEIILTIVKQMTFIKSCLWGMQKEVAQRLCTGKKSSSLGIFLRAYGELRLMNLIKKNSFFPKPNVDAYWVFWKRSHKIEQFELFESFLKSAFWGKRKTMMNALKRSPHLNTSITDKWLKKIEFLSTDRLKILMQKRPDALDIDDYLFIFHWIQS